MKKIFYHYALLCDSIGSHSTIDKIFTKDNLTELPQFPGGKTCIHHIFNGRLMIMDYF